MEKVSLLRVDSYNNIQIRNSLERVIELSGFNMSLFQNRVVALKPNLLTAASPEKGLTTHPVVFHEMVKIVKEAGGDPVLVESPAFLPLSKVIKKTGYAEIIEKEKVRVGDTGDTVLIKNPGQGRFRVFEVARDFAEADFIINLPKMKTHGLTYFTGAVKNYFGLIHGLEKSKYHFRADTPESFSMFIIDLYAALISSKEKGSFLNIMDGITGLEGEGPGASGKPVNAYAMIAGSDALAVDTVAVKIAGLDMKKNLISIYGSTRGAGTGNLEKIMISGDSINDFSARFKPPASRSSVSGWPFSSPFFKNALIEKPVPIPDKCTLCYQCRTICPADAVGKTVDNKIPLYDYSKCIRCYCCMEICPEAAIELKKSILQRIIRY